MFDHAGAGSATGAQQAVSEELHATLLRSLESGLRTIAGRVSFNTINVSDKLDLSNCNMCTCNVGFYSNGQIIGNLLHMIVQLALFPRPSAEDVGIQHEQDMQNTAVFNAAVQTDLHTASMETQTAILRAENIGVQAGQEVKLAESQTEQVKVCESVVQTDTPVTLDAEVQCQQQWVGQWEWADLPLPPFQGPLIPLSLPQRRSRSLPRTLTQAVRIGGGYDVLHDLTSTEQVLAETRQWHSPVRPVNVRPSHGAPSRSTSPDRFGVGIIGHRTGYKTERGLPISNEQLPQPLSETIPEVTLRPPRSTMPSTTRGRERLYRFMRPRAENSQSSNVASTGISHHPLVNQRELYYG